MLFNSPSTNNEISSRIKAKETPYFINCFFKFLTNQRTSKTSVANELQVFLQHLKAQNKASPVLNLNQFLGKAMPRIALREYKAGGKKVLLPKPMSFKKLRRSFIKNFLSELKQQQGPEKKLHLKIIKEINEFYASRSFTYTKKIDAYIIAKQNRRQAKFVFRRKKYKKTTYNAFEKNKFSNI